MSENIKKIKCIHSNTRNSGLKCMVIPAVHETDHDPTYILSGISYDDLLSSAVDGSLKILVNHRISDAIYPISKVEYHSDSSDSDSSDSENPVQARSITEVSEYKVANSFKISFTEIETSQVSDLPEAPELGDLLTDNDGDDGNDGDDSDPVEHEIVTENVSTIVDMFIYLNSENNIIVSALDPSNGKDTQHDSFTQEESK